MPLSLALGQRFERLSTQVETLEDLAHRGTVHAAQRDVFAERLAGTDASGVPGVTLRTLYEPVEGALGDDFVGVQVVGARLDVVVGDVTGHGFNGPWHLRTPVTNVVGCGRSGPYQFGRPLGRLDCPLPIEA